MIGETIGHYKVTEKIGQGGMGVVYRATDVRLGRQIALKVLPKEATADPDRRARFLYEAQSASRLNHPNIVTIYEIGDVGEATFIAMEYVDGTPLEGLIRPGGLPVADVLRLASQIADALAAAHLAGIIHRDLKPANIMVSGAQHVTLLDFGLAKPVAPGLDESANSLTRSLFGQPAPHTREGLIIGSVGYMSPEQLSGHRVDPRTDIFSFGCVVHEMITGDPPFRSDTAMSTLIALATRDPAPISDTRRDVPPDLVRLVTNCLHKVPDDRPARISDVAGELQRLAQLQGTSRAFRSIFLAHVRRSLRTKVAAAAIGATVIAVGVGVWRRSTPDPSTLPPTLTQLTEGAGLTTDPAVSPDGRMLAYASDVDGAGLDIYIRPLGGGTPTRLTTDGADDYDPAFSSDGRTIAFRSERGGGGVYHVPSVGGSQQLIAVNGRSPRYSPDGKWIAYWVGTPGGGTRDDLIYLAPVGGGTAHEWLAGWGSRSEPVWSPDASRILFLGTIAGSKEYLESTDWWSASVDGGAVLRLGAVKALRQPPFVYSPLPELWLPDNRLVFTRSGSDGTSIWQVRLDATGAIAGAAERLTTPGAPIETRPALGPGGRLVYGNVKESFNIWALPLDPERGTPAGDPRRITEGPFADAAPSVTPDGKKMTFISNRQGHDQVWMYDMESGRQVQLTRGETHKVFPIIDRTASRLAYAQAEGGPYAIFTMAPGGGVTRRVCAECGLPRSWVPESDRILYQSGNPSALWTVDTTTGEKRTLATYDYGLYSPRFSFDERWLVFHARIHPDATRILIAPYRNGTLAPSAEWIAITSGEFEDDKPRWAPGDDLIYFLSRRDGFRCLWVQRLEPATKRPLDEARVVRHFHEAGLGMMQARFNQFDLAVARDKLLMTLAERKGNLWLAAADTAR